MAVSIGKRKRQEESDGATNSSEDENAFRALFQRAFEAKFKPLERSAPLSESEASEGHGDVYDVQDDSNWDGLSDHEGSLEVIHHHTEFDGGQSPQKNERKAFMSSKPPEIAQKDAVLPKVKLLASEEDSTEAANLKHDLALQRLLKESHLIDRNGFMNKVPAPESKGRLEALDLRLRNLGAKESVSRQQKMPLLHRKGISAKARDRGEKRRKEATENGVVLEKAKAATASAKRRERSVGGPTIGKFNGGTLKLSSRHVKTIEGPRERGLGRRKGRR